MPEPWISIFQFAGGLEIEESGNYFAITRQPIDTRRLSARLLRGGEAQCPQCGTALNGFSQAGPVTVMLVGRWRVRERTENEWTLEPCGHVFSEAVRATRRAWPAAASPSPEG